jgi:hypothetical protein
MLTVYTRTPHIEEHFLKTHAEHSFRWQTHKPQTKKEQKRPTKMLPDVDFYEDLPWSILFCFFGVKVGVKKL